MPDFGSGTSKGLVAGLGALWPDSPVICDDHSWGQRGLQGWTQLHDSTLGFQSPIGIEPLGHGGGEYLTLRTKNGATGYERDCTCIKRLNHVASVYDLEVWWAWRSIYGQNGIRAIDFALDNATADGTRYFMKYRWAHYTSANRDGTGSWTRTNRLQVVASDSLYSDLPGSPIYAAAINENKSDLNYFKGRFDVARGLYLGCQWGPDRYGCFADDPTAGQAAFEALGQGPLTTLPTFAYGLNPTIEIFGRVDTAANDAVVNVDRARLTVVS